MRGPGTIAREVRATAALALPLAATQLAQMLIHLTETVLLGRYSATALAAGSLAMISLHFFLMFAQGFVSAAAPLIASAIGQGRPVSVRRVLGQGLLACWLVSLPLILCLWNLAPVLRALGQDEAILADAQAYIRYAAFSLPLFCTVIVLRAFLGAHDQTRAILVSTLIAVALNIPLSWALIFGWFGPAFEGAAGAGLGVSISFLVMALAMVVASLRLPALRRYRLARGFRGLDPSILREIARLGVPIGLILLLETGLFTGSALVMGRLGITELAAHQIAMQLAGTSFMVPLGIGFAATLRVGMAHGRGDIEGARLAGSVAVAMGALFMGVIAVAYWLVPAPFVSLFVSADGASAAVHATAIGLLQIAALFQIFDSTQAIAAASLRGLKDTRTPLVYAGTSYWLIGFPITWLLAFHTDLGGIGVWLGIATGLAAAAFLMLVRFIRLTRKG